MKKYYKEEDGERYVAIVYSPSFGAGWSSWGIPDDGLFDPDLVKLILENDTPSIIEYAERTWPGVYIGAASSLEIYWALEGRKFVIHEYDGAESIQFCDTEWWITA